MMIFSKNQEYEKAQQAKNIILHLKTQELLKHLWLLIKNLSIVGIDISNFDVVISCLLIRNGRIIGKLKRHLNQLIQSSTKNIYHKLFSIFSENQPSDEILVSHIFLLETVQKSLSEKWDKSIVLKTPVKDGKKSS